MSGFAGLFRRSGEDASAPELDAMVEALAHRGPDDRGTARDGPVGLGHCLLRTTPESRYASLPARGEDGRHVLTMDARVDNRAELCEALGLEDGPTLTDAGILLAAYEEWATGCFERIVGAFAVVVHDRERGRLVCARDPTGIKPFYYALGEDLFAFGSEPKAILSLPDVSGTVDDASVFAFLAEEFDHPRATFFEPVSRLPPGHVLVVDADAARIRSYWSPAAVGELHLPTDEAYERRFRELFAEAVGCRLRRPPGTKATSFVSGGLDSTSIACVAQSLLAPEEPLRTFSVTYEGYPASDESEYLRAALDAYEFDARVTDAGGTTPFPDLDRRLAHHDAPFYPPLFVMDRQFADELSAPDVRIVLDGLGGDQTLYYGTRYLTELLRRGRPWRFVEEFEGFVRNWGWSPRALFMRSVAGPFAPRPVRWAWHKFHGTDGYPRIDVAKAEAVGFPERFGDDRSPPRSHREEQRRDVADPTQNFFFEVNDVERARFGVEPRYPYFDRRLVEFCLALPADQKIRRGVGRHVLRRALRGVLPETIRTRTDKAEFSQSWIDGLHRHELDRLHERLIRSPRHVTAYTDGGLREAYRRFADEPSYEDAVTLSNAYAIESWLRTLDGGG